MPQEVTILLYQYSELSEAAKEKAKAWWFSCMDSSDYESTVEDFIEVAAILGVEVGTRNQRTMGGGTRAFPDVRWSLSHSQGDGAAFSGSYAYAKGAAKRIREYAPKDTELHRIADALQAVQARNLYGVRATMSDGLFSNLYSHSGTMTVNVEFLDQRGNERDTRPHFDADDESVTELMRDLADWLHKQLRDAEEWLTSDEQVAEAMAANEYTFDERGRRA